MLHLSSEFDIPRDGGRGVQDTSDQHVADSGCIIKSPSVAYNLDMSRTFRHFLNQGWVATGTETEEPRGGPSRL